MNGDDAQIEEWKPVVGWEETHEVSNLGRVRSLNRKGCGGRILRLGKTKKGGYPTAALHYKGSGETTFVHRLVMLAFNGPPPEEMKHLKISSGIRHLDGDNLNNRPENLQWMTTKTSKACAKKVKREEEKLPRKISSRKSCTKRSKDVEEAFHPPGTISLTDVLIDRRTGITTSRFLAQQDAVNCIVLKNESLKEKADPLSLFATKGEAFAFADNPHLPHHRLQAGDVLLPLRFIRFSAACVPNTISEWSRIDGVEAPCYAANNMVVLTPRVDLILPEYLTLWLRSDTAIEQIAQLSKQESKAGKSYGRGFSSINISDLHRLSICVPSLDVQADICRFYDDTVHEKQRLENLLENRFMETRLNDYTQ